MENGISFGLILLLFTVSLKGDCGKRILIFLVYQLRPATYTEDLLLSSLSKIIVLDLVDGVSLTTCLVPFPFSVTTFAILPCPLFDRRRESNQLVKSWRP